MLNKGLILLMLTTALAPSASWGKDAKCIIKQGGAIAYSGSCTFMPRRDGSFTIRNNKNTTIVPNVTNISVDITSSGIAEVRGLTIYGNNSRWGTATRSKKDPDCWNGQEFEICAY